MEGGELMALMLGEGGLNWAWMMTSASHFSLVAKVCLVERCRVDVLISFVCY
jgi:hypothetical protein